MDSLMSPFACKVTHVRRGASLSLGSPTDTLQAIQEDKARPAAVITVTSALRQPLRNDPSFRSTMAQRAWVATGCTSVLATLIKAAAAAAAAGDHHHHHVSWIECAMGGAMGYVLADLCTGVYHWAVDNYGDATTPLVGGQIEAFQGHHRWPWAITRREFANNLWALARPTAILLTPWNLLPCQEAGLHAFVGIFMGCLMFSQQFHAWSHNTKSRLPPLVVALQDASLLIPRGMHGAHHRPPYNNNYCIVSGIWNKHLDDVKFFEVLEMVVFFRFGVRPRSWSETSIEWLEDGQAFR